MNWEKTPLTTVAPALAPAYWSRPFFTACKDGAFYTSAWMSYDEPITEYDPESEANRVPCRSGACRDGICSDDLDFIEGKLGPGDKLVPGTFFMESKDCRVCNPNNALYSVWQTDGSTAGNICDGGSICCENHLPHDGPCDIENAQWIFGFGSEDGQLGLSLQAYGNTPCVGPSCDLPGQGLCAAVKGGACVEGTSTLQEIDWVNDECDSLSVGLIKYNGEMLMIGSATIWMGNRKDFFNVINGMPTCGPAEKQGLMSMSYFTCSGAAIIESSRGRWFKAVWIHRYDPSNCEDKPCWMAAHENLPVEFSLVELPGDPALTPARK